MTARRERIGIVLNALDVGGAEQMVTGLLTAWRATAQHDFVLFVLRSGGALEPTTRDAGWPIISLDSRARFSPVAVTRLASSVRRERIGLLHAHLPRSGILAGLVASWRGIPSVYTEHSLWTAYHPLTRAAHITTLSRHEAIVAVSRPVRDALVAKRPDLASRVHLVENGVAVDTLRRSLSRRDRLRADFGLSPSELVVLNVGNLRPAKNQASLVRAFAALPDDLRARSRLLIVGRDDGEAARLQELVDRLGIAGRVEFTGPRQDVSDLIAACDLFVLSSVVEGLPLSLLEAGAMGRPSVATRVGGVPDVLNGRNGRLVESGDDAALAAAIEDLLRDPVGRSRMGLEAESVIRSRFAIERAAAAYEGVYAQLLSGVS